jgi:hypothetical protein
MLTIIESRTTKKDLANVLLTSDNVGPFELPFSRTLPNGLTVDIDPKRITISNLDPLRNDQVLVYNPKNGETKEMTKTPLYRLKTFFEFPCKVRFPLKEQTMTTITSQTLDKNLMLKIITSQTTPPSHQTPGT